jgi:ribose-phosphate pyrophosphokinase
VFAEDSYERLMAAGARQVVSTDTIPHPACNAIAMAPLLASACESMLGGLRDRASSDDLT